MKGLPLVFIITLIFITTSCSKEAADTSLQIDTSIKQIIFFSNESEYQYEASYYDAIIELKKEFPEEIKNMLTLSPAKAKQYYDTFKVKDCPAIIVIYQDQIIAKVDGETTKEQIVKPIAQVLAKDL